MAMPTLLACADGPAGVTGQQWLDIRGEAIWRSPCGFTVPMAALARWVGRDPASGQATGAVVCAEWPERLFAAGAGYERAAAVDGGDEASFAEYLHGAADGAVCDAVMLGQFAFGAEPGAGCQFAGGAAGGDVVGDADVGEVLVVAVWCGDLAHS